MKIMYQQKHLVTKIYKQMKNLLILISLLLVLSCKAQSPIIPIEKRNLPEDYRGAYFKDVDNDLNKFQSTWKYTNGSTSFTISFLKKELSYVGGNYDYYQDKLIGEYQYIENGVEKVNTLADFDNTSISGYKHNINGGLFQYRLPSTCTDNNDVAEIKVWVLISDPTDDDITGEVYLRYVNDNGTEKLEMCINDHTVTGDDPNARVAMPDGNYELIKQ
jgi:hypothetical protein